MEDDGAAMLYERVHADVSAILDLADEEIGEFLRDQIAQKRLSELVGKLNALVLDGDATEAQQASLVFQRLGFVNDGV